MHVGRPRLLGYLSRWRIEVAWLAPLAILCARPTRSSIMAGLPLVVAALALRACAQAHLERGRYLTQTGPYAYMRHPLYVGSFLLGLGLAMMANVLPLTTIFAIAFLVLYVPKSLREEAFLARTYGAAYQRYAARVPALMPRLRPAPVSRATRAAQRFSWRRLLKGEWRAWLGVLAALLALTLMCGAFGPQRARAAAADAGASYRPFCTLDTLNRSSGTPEL